MKPPLSASMKIRQTILAISISFCLLENIMDCFKSNRQIIMNPASPFTATQGLTGRSPPYPGSPQESTAHAALLTAPRLASQTSRPSQETRTEDTAASHCPHRCPGLRDSLLENQTEALAGSVSINNEQHEDPKTEPAVAAHPPPPKRKHIQGKALRVLGPSMSSQRAPYLCQLLLLVKSFVHQLTQNLQLLKALFLFNPTHFLLFG